MSLGLWGALKECLIKAVLTIIPSQPPAFASLSRAEQRYLFIGCLMVMVPRELPLENAIYRGGESGCNPLVFLSWELIL